MSFLSDRRFRAGFVCAVALIAGCTAPERAPRASEGTSPVHSATMAEPTTSATTTAVPEPRVIDCGDPGRPFRGRVLITTEEEVMAMLPAPQGDRRAPARQNAHQMLFLCEITADGRFQVTHPGTYFPRQGSDIRAVFSLVMAGLTGYAEYWLDRDLPNYRFEVHGQQAAMWAGFDINQVVRQMQERQPEEVRHGAGLPMRIRRLVPPPDIQRLAGERFWVYLKNRDHEIVSPGDTGFSQATVVTNSRKLAELLEAADTRHQPMIWDR